MTQSISIYLILLTPSCNFSTHELTHSIQFSVIIHECVYAVNECMVRAKREETWSFDKASVAYRHGGAGNNWALGYSMCSGEFLEASLDCIRFVHSLFVLSSNSLHFRL